MKRLSHIFGSKIIQGKGTGTPSTNHVLSNRLVCGKFFIKKIFCFCDIFELWKEN